MKAVFISDLAQQDIEDIHAYIARDNEVAADRIARRNFEATDQLEHFPEMDRVGKASGTRELVVAGTPYVVVYRVRSDDIEIARVIHHARDWPRAR
ncbi:MAG: type II toxin-antitoxin system RelE/ParE family toxin [Myxococcota bacterium]